jgi:hypothetical protein
VEVLHQEYIGGLDVAMNEFPSTSRMDIGDAFCGSKADLYSGFPI